MTARFSSLNNTVAAFGAVFFTAALLFASTPVLPIA